nr:putative nucleotidyltransferase, ribonuclease H [Tanacetum cinerariifolium]
VGLSRGGKGGDVTEEGEKRMAGISGLNATVLAKQTGKKTLLLGLWDFDNISPSVEERVIEGPEMIKVTNEKVAVAKEKLKEAHTRQKSYADKHRRLIEFQLGDRVFLKVSPAR